MKTLKDFLLTEEITLPEQVEEVAIPEELMVTEQPNFRVGVEKQAQKHQERMDPPAVLIMRRKSIRQFPNNQRVALYFVDKINKYVTVPYTAMQWSAASMPEEFELSSEVIDDGVINRLEDIVENQKSKIVRFEDGKTMLVGVSIAETILKVHSALNEENQEKLVTMANKSKEQFGKVIDFAKKNLK